jgi:hypothetical protein
MSRTDSEEGKSRNPQREEHELISFGETTYTAYSSIYSPARLWLWSNDGILHLEYSLQYEMKGFDSSLLAMSREALDVPRSGFVSG